MTKYPKIDTLWKRDDKKQIIAGSYSDEVFLNIRKWTVQNKYDGMNIRVVFEKKIEKLYDGSGWQVIHLDFYGKTDDAKIPVGLLSHLKETFPEKKMKDIFSKSTKVVLYGEGYGEKINNNRQNLKGCSFALFDAVIDGWWLEPKTVEKLAKDLGTEYVGSIGIRTIPDIINMVEEMAQHQIDNPNMFHPEGIVAKAHPMVLFRNKDKTPVMFKLKVKDYLKL